MPYSHSRSPGLLRTLIALSAVGWFCLPTEGLANPRYVYSDDNEIQTRHPDWMSWLPDSISISELSLPGTHDTMSRFGGGFVRTQELYLDRQLLAGIRVLDVRARHIDDRFAIHHGAFYQNAMFGEVLQKAAQFLDAHPGETILMRFGGEGVTPKGGENVTRSFAKTYEWYRDETIHGSKIWQRPDATRADGMPTDQCGSNDNAEGKQQDYIPTLGEVRGKIVILQDFKNGADSDSAPAGPPCYGIWYRSNTAMEIQDTLDVITIFDIEDKWDDVRNHLTATKNGSPSVLYMNYLSDFSIFAAPLTIAGGSSVITGVNDYALEHLLVAGLDRTGIMMMDFPGAALIDAIIAHNFPLRDPTLPITVLNGDFGYVVNNIAYGGTEIGDDKQARDRRQLLKVFLSRLLPDQRMNYIVSIDDINPTGLFAGPELFTQTDYIGTDNVLETRKYTSFVFNTQSPEVYSEAELIAFVDGQVAAGLGSGIDSIVQNLYQRVVAAFPGSFWNVFAKDGDGGFDNWAYSIAGDTTFYRREIAGKSVLVMGTGFRCPILAQPNALRFNLVETGRPLIEWNPVPNAVGYEIVVSDNPLFHHFRHDTRYLSPLPLAPGAYDFSVHAAAAAGCEGPSAFLSVTIPEEPVLLGIEVVNEGPAGLGSGSVSVAPAPTFQIGGNYYTPGDVVTLTATPTERSEFMQWNGDAASCGASTTCELTIVDGSNIAASAAFRPKPSLVVYEAGAGSVDVDPEGPACSNAEYACFIYSTGSQVSMTPMPFGDSVFDRWKGDSDCADGMVSMEANRTCTAVFKRTSHSLIVAPSEGSEVISDPPGAIDCGAETDCDEFYLVSSGEQTEVLEATINPGFVFVRWAGAFDCWNEDEDDDDPLRISLTVGAKDVECRVISVLEGTEYALTVEKLGGGTVTAEAVPSADSSGIDCPQSACSQHYVVNTLVELTAMPTRGSVFAGWDGDPDCDDGIVSMVDNVDCIATFNSSVLVVNGDNDDTSKEQNQYISVLNQLEFIDYEIWHVKNPNSGDNSTDPATGDRRVEPVAADLAPFGRVLWYTGRAADDPTDNSPVAGPSPAAEASLAEYLDSGGCLMLSSPQYYRDRGLTSFAQNYLGVNAFTEDVFESHVRATGDPSLGFNELVSEIGVNPPNPFRFQATSATHISDAMVHDPDVPGTDVLFEYRDGSGEAGVVVDNGIYRSAVLGFPFLGLNSGNDRINVLSAFMDLCGQPPRDDLLEINDDFDQATDRNGTVSLNNLRILPGNDDYFRWVSEWYADTRIAISFAHGSGDLSIEIYDDSRALIHSSQGREDEEEVVVPDLNEGDVLYVRVYGVDDASTPYQLHISAAGPSDRDHDGVPDLDDALPEDASEQFDADGDLIGDNADLDDDNDGMPDAYELLNDFDPLDAADAALDKDGDSFSNLAECQAGSDPDDPNSVPVAAPVASATPPDSDADGVPDASDNCILIFNPRLGELGAPLRLDFQTTTGGQLDDDADGVGNACDAKFTNQGDFVGGLDLSQHLASFNKDRTLSECGTSGLEPCARYDLDNLGTFISGGDLNIGRQLFNALPGPKCESCPLACEGPACP